MSRAPQGLDFSLSNFCYTHQHATWFFANNVFFLWLYELKSLKLRNYCLSYTICFPAYCTRPRMHVHTSIRVYTVHTMYCIVCSTTCTYTVLSNTCNLLIRVTFQNGLTLGRPRENEHFRKTTRHMRSWAVIDIESLKRFINT